MGVLQSLLEKQPGSRQRLTPDLFLLNDDLRHTPLAGVSPDAAERCLVILDHDIPAGSFDTAFRQKALIDVSRQFDLPFIQSAGIGYTLLCEDKVKAGDLVLGWGDHVCAVGAVGALGLQVSDKALASLLKTNTYELSTPSLTWLRLTGTLPQGSSAYDAALGLLAPAAGAHRDQLLLLTDETVSGLSLGQRMTLCQLLHRFGALSALFVEPEEAKALTGADPGAAIDLSAAAACVVHPGSLDRIVPLSQEPDVKVDACFLGGCCGGQIEELRRAAQLLRGKRICQELRLTIGFASNRVYLQAMEEGLIPIFLDCGAQVTNPGCSSCLTTSIGVVGDGETLVSTGCYNYPGCCGTENSRVYLAGTDTVIRAALTGVLSGKGDV